MAEVLGTMLWCVTEAVLTLCEWRAPGCGGGAGNLLTIAHFHTLIIRLIVDHVYLAQGDNVQSCR